MRGRLVRVPVGLTTDPYYRKGQTGHIADADRAADKVTVLFGDGQEGNYRFNALETLHDKNRILSGMKEKLKEFNKEEAEAIHRIIKHVEAGEQWQALNVALTNSKVKACCMTDLDTYYAIHKDIKPYKMTPRRRIRRG